VHLLVIVQNSQVLNGNYTAVKQQTLEAAQQGFQSPLDELATGTGLWPPHSADMNECFYYWGDLQQKFTEKLNICDGSTEENSLTLQQKFTGNLTL